MTTEKPGHVHHDRHDAKAHDEGDATCPQCLVQTPKSGSAKVAWAIAVVAVLLLVGFFLFGSGSPLGNVTGASGLVLLAILACPLTMGAMMFFMMRKPM